MISPLLNDCWSANPNSEGFSSLTIWSGWIVIGNPNSYSSSSIGYLFALCSGEKIPEINHRAKQAINNQIR